MNRKLKIAFVLQSRFEAFELAKALIQRGQDVTVFINYPAFALKRFGMDPARTKRFVLHGILERVLRWFAVKAGFQFPEAWLTQLFGRWAAVALAKDQWDVIFGMSGISEEFLRNPPLKKSLKIVIRASAHIDTQFEILSEEEKRIGRSVEKPSAWMREREKREYGLADAIRVLSQFSHASFLKFGVDEKKLWLNASANPASDFMVDRSLFEKRRVRIIRGEKLNILYVGNLSFQKGMWDLMQIAKKIPVEKFNFLFVGQQQPEAQHLFLDTQQNIKLSGKVTQFELKAIYAESDIFLYPTLQDGFPAVLGQAYISGLPIITTPNSCAPELIKDGKTGWILPVRSPEAFIKKLLWCDEHRVELADRVTAIEAEVFSTQFRTWDEAANEAEEYLKTAIK